MCLSGYNGALLSVLEMAARSTCANRLSKVASGWGCSEDVLDYCEKHGIGFIPWAPVATGRLSKSGSIDDIAKAHGATPSQIALACFSNAVQSCCPFRAPRKPRTWKKMSPLSKSIYRIKSSPPLIDNTTPVMTCAL